jgi:hypothetical protein
MLVHYPDARCQQFCISSVAHVAASEEVRPPACEASAAAAIVEGASTSNAAVSSAGDGMCHFWQVPALVWADSYDPFKLLSCQHPLRPSLVYPQDISIVFTFRL